MNSPMIFVTHSSHDATTATKIRDYLESNGIQCWMAPRDIPIGEEWAKGILTGINTASGMLLVFSSNSNDSSQVRREIERAIHNNIPIYPVRIEDVQPSDAMEYYISSNHWMDAFGGNFETNLDKLVAAIKSKHNITLESESEPTSKPIKTKEQSPTLTSQVTDKSFKRKLAFPKLSFKISKKILFSMAFLLLLLAGFFILKSFENSNPDAIIAEVIAPQPLDTINTFVRMIASTNEFDDYVAGIKVTEDGNYVIMGYSSINDYEGKPWIAMFDSVGNEMWKHEGPCAASRDGAFDIFPDGRCVWAYPMNDSTLVNNSGISKHTKEYLSSNGEVIFSDTSIIGNTNQFYGSKTNLLTNSYGRIRDIHVCSNKVFIRTISFFCILTELDEENNLYLIGEASSGGIIGSTANVFTTEFELAADSFIECNKDIGYSILMPFISNVVVDDEKVYSFILEPFETPFRFTFNAASRFLNINIGLPMEETDSNTYFISQNTTMVTLLNNDPILVSNGEEGFFLISLLPDNDFHCIKVDRAGNEIWYKTFGTPTSDDVLRGAILFDEVLYLYGRAYSIENDSFDGYLEAISQDGQVLFQNYFDFGNDEVLVGLEETPEGGFVLVIESSVNGTRDIYLVKVDSLIKVQQYDLTHNEIVYETWTNPDAIRQEWFNGISGNWHLSNQVMSSNDTLLSLRNDIAVIANPFRVIQAYSVSIKMGSLGFANRGSHNYIRFGLLGDDEFADNDFSLRMNPNRSLEFASLCDYEEGSRVYYTDETVWLHWDYGSNSSFELCGRIGVGYFNGDSIVVGRIEPDTAWVEYGVLNDFEIRLDGGTVDFYINDLLFFHTDEFVCDSDSLYLYLGGVSNTIPNAIGEVRVTSE